QLAALACLAIAAARRRGKLAAGREAELAEALGALPGRIQEILAQEKFFAGIAEEIAEARDALYIGRGTNYAIALEGALKLKEISYIHAEAFAAGELKHGPLALVERGMPVVVIAPRDRWFA